MLREYSSLQESDECKRRWFSNNYFDIFVWENDRLSITKIQLCYDKSMEERVLTWTIGDNFCHDLIDNGEAFPSKNNSPIFIHGGVFPAKDVLERFSVDSRTIDSNIRAFVLRKLEKYLRSK
jgi:hypothetical protein